ncbi:class I SAM-dependent methyltransferase [Crocosphaera watsonii WH 8501]|uniref:UbiE/COQ5 methyltransferase n=1 Tax=Crocosphaera watsonii WH 8501 TaxID=165597 RepID=Q4BW43_CROWT|nr:class I SAM-dependent methyltransferase [Crocosphaera watsonii]EAM48126.1 UbiE/COQ5 methyltransferase [Crocosphaera watsonii WH 8501]
MQSTPNPDLLSPFSEALTKFAYQGFQQTKSLFSFAHKNISDRLTNTVIPSRQDMTSPLSPELLLKLQESRSQLCEIDWEDVQKGIYPVEVLFDSFLPDLLRYYPEMWLDLPKIWSRLQRKEYQSFADDIEKEGYPGYYLQNFHHQTDGYLSDSSANLYDLQVDILFNGIADGMRRRILTPLKEGLTTFSSVPAYQIKVLDVACGTGRTLKALRATFPKASLFGVDLSPAYLRKANQLLSENPRELPQLSHANAEDLPHPDNFFHGVSCVFLFHELPGFARQAVIEECFRVTKPGGTFVICDSMQLADTPEFEGMLNNFSAMFHEPYYQDYIRDKLGERLEKAGFELLETQLHFLSKYWVARKPDSTTLIQNN